MSSLFAADRAQKNLNFGIFIAAPGPLRFNFFIRNFELNGRKMYFMAETPTLHDSCRPSELELHQYDPAGKYKCFVLEGPEPRRGTALFRSAVGPKPDQLRGSRRIFKAYGHV